MSNEYDNYTYLRTDILVEPHQAGVRWEPGDSLNAKALANAGLDMSLFTPAKVAADSQSFLDRQLPAANLLRVRVAYAKPLIVFNPLTKTGKVPKNVAKVSMQVQEAFVFEMIKGHETTRFGDQVICYTQYLATGEINIADYHLWREHILHSVHAVNVRGRLFVTQITKLINIDNPTSAKDTLWREDFPIDNLQQNTILHRSLSDLR